MSALRHILDIPYPTTRYLCTYKTASKTWPHLENHKLNTVSDHLQFSFTHHNALEDALACANVLLAAMREKHVDSPDDLAKMIGMRIGTMREDGYSPCSVRKRRKSSP
jgi:DNA polymerase-3 subunit epsilon